MPVIPCLQGWAPMTLSSLSFLYVFLPISLLIYYYVPQKYRTEVLVWESLFFYALAQPQGLVLILVSLALDYCAAYVMTKHSENRFIRRGCVWFSALKSIAIIAGVGAAVQIRSLPVQLGYSVYTLLSIDAIISLYQNKVDFQRNPAGFAAYCLFYPRLFAGPLQPYGDFFSQINCTSFQIRTFINGLCLFIQGLAKNAVIGNQMNQLYGNLSVLTQKNVSTLLVWSLVLVLALNIYFTLSGYCDMARGLGQMYGFSIPLNFYYPYQSRSITDFFERFQITFSDFIRRHVYSHLKPEGGGKTADSLNLLVFGMLMGVWFGLRINYLVWGAYLALFLIMERYVYKKLLENTPVLICRVATFCIVLSSFTILAGSSLNQSLYFVKIMFRINSTNVPGLNNSILYFLSSNWLLLVIGCFLSTSGLSLGVDWFRKQFPVISSIVITVVDLLLLLLVTAMLL